MCPLSLHIAYVALISVRIQNLCEARRLTATPDHDASGKYRDTAHFCFAAASVAGVVGTLLT